MKSGYSFKLRVAAELKGRFVGLRAVGIGSNQRKRYRAADIAIAIAAGFGQPEWPSQPIRDLVEKIAVKPASDVRSNLVAPDASYDMEEGSPQQNQWQPEELTFGEQGH